MNWVKGEGKRVKGLALLALLALGGCHTDMWRQPKTSPLSESQFFEDGMSARTLVKGTVARGHARLDEPFYTGVQNGQWLNELPMPVTKELLERGHERFDIYCSPCHGRLGDGEGMIAKRGLDLVRKPASYHTQRLREMPVGFFYHVITNGSGVMYSYASRVEPKDRWAIAAYIRALQLSQNGKVTDLTAEERSKLLGTQSTEHGEGEHKEGGQRMTHGVPLGQTAKQGESPEHEGAAH